MHRSSFLLAFALLLPAACGDGDHAVVWQAKSAYDSGDIDGAEKILGVADSDEANDLRAQIKATRENRLQVTIDCERLVAKTDMLTLSQAQATLANMRAKSTDAVARATIEKALSDLPKAVAKRQTDAKAAQEAAVQQQMAAEAAAEDAKIKGTLNDIRRLMAQREWVKATDLVKKSKSEDAAPAADLDALTKQIDDGAIKEIEQLNTQSVNLEIEKGPAAAMELLQAASVRFPSSPKFSALTERLSDLKRRAGAGKGSGKSSRLFSPRGAHVLLAQVRAAPEGRTAEQLVELARDGAEHGALEFARECWLAASNKTLPGDLRDDYVGEAQDLRARIALHTELADAWNAAPKTFAALGLTAIDDLGWKQDDKVLAWNEIALADYAKVVERFGLSKLARRGVVCETLRSTSTIARDAAMLELARMVAHEDIDGAEAANIVARAKGGVGAKERYVLVGERWVARSVIESNERAAELAKLQRNFEMARPAAREAALQALGVFGGPELLASELKKHTETALSRMKRTRTLEQIDSLAELRRELDTARKAALDAIFDEKVYFYPYNPPEPPNTAGDYARAQRHVDELVSAVRGVWEKKKAVHVPSEFREALDDYAWCLHEHKEHEIAIDALPAYVLSVPLDRDELDLRTFAWDADEAAALLYDRRVEARNEALWKDYEGKRAKAEPAATPDNSEREQVRITNAYRVMFGRRALAWNPQIQVAAQGHSDYMANTGDFGHFEQDPKRHGPTERLRLAGYKFGGSENCAMGGGDPKSAHDGWCHSSGHHRNILEASHREMASGVASFYWTQNFGAGTEFVKELEQRND